MVKVWRVEVTVDGFAKNGMAYQTSKSTKTSLGGQSSLRWFSG